MEDIVPASVKTQKSQILRSIPPLEAKAKAKTKKSRAEPIPEREVNNTYPRHPISEKQRCHHFHRPLFARLPAGLAAKQKAHGQGRQKITQREHHHLPRGGSERCTS